jgi:predicted regulator of Ras-like GTPase activity (Roadblock/LC7/MglB family)
VQAEIQQSGQAGAQLALPVGEVDLARRKGKIVFTWKTLRSWMEPPGSAASTSDDDELPLPLKVVAPRFLALRQPKSRQRKAHVEESIPDLFSGGPAAEAPASPRATPEAQPEPVETEPVAPAIPVAMPAAPKKPAAAKSSASISAANPKDLVSKTAQLPGVSGALLAMNDGLVVASKLAQPLQGETVAAFLPQIFGRLTQISNELKLGDLSTVMLVMDNCRWIIFRSGKVFFAVVGTAGEALPLPQLTAIVADIKRQNL